MTQAPMTTIKGRYSAFGIVLLLAGIGGVAVGYGQGLPSLGQSYLFAWVVWASLTLGCFGLSLLFHITRGRWGTPLLRIFEAGGGPVNLMIMILTFIPIAFVFRDGLYHHWIHPEAGDMILARKKTYLNEPFWLARVFLIPLTFVAISAALQTWTKLEEKTGDPKYGEKRNNTASIFTVWFILAMTFYITDIIMSLDPHWYSTIMPVTFVVASALFAMGFAVVTIVQSKNQHPFKGVMEDDLMKRDFGNLLLMLTMVWTYFTFSQLLIIWSGNLPVLTQYYRARTTGQYGALGAMQLAGNFLLPFLALLVIPIKRSAPALGFVAGMIVLFRFNDLYYLIMPFLRSSLSITAGDLGCTALLGGVFFLSFSALLRRDSLIVKAFPSQPVTKEATSHA